ncbi:MAG: hypothetical protein CL537_04995 [Alcanivoracaceae bacterium]|nr:hypothetical protein [Alcanivoracaceae bacterium]|tara:strand:+ start:15936 stop:16658 length:723 start_codon:yes stop_codon:yes gene_type:complete
MGNKFFRIVGVTSYILAALALAVAIFATIASGSAWLTGVDEEIQQPEIGMKGYREYVNPEIDNDEPAGLGEMDRKNREEENSAIQEKINNLAVLINKYARLTSQGSANKEGLDNWLRSQAGSLPHPDYLRFLDGIIESFDSDLVKPAENEDSSLLVTNIPGLENADTTHINWDKYLEWFTWEYMSRYQSELTRIEQERVEQAQAKAGSLVTLIIAGCAFAIFVFATVILLLVRIESNTRK